MLKNRLQNGCHCISVNQRENTHKQALFILIANGSKRLFVKSRSGIPDPCLSIRFFRSGRIISINLASKLPGELRFSWFLFLILYTKFDFT